MAIKVISLICLVLLNSGPIQGIAFEIHLRGVYQSKITLLSSSGVTAIPQIIFMIDSVKNGETAMMQLSSNHIPGEFVLRFDYKEYASSTSYPSEKRIIINDQDLHLWVHPIYCNNADSTWFQKDERENKTYLQFLEENGKKLGIINLLQNFLLNYDATNSTFYMDGILEYERRRSEFNQWITEQTKTHEELFVSNLFGFYHIPQIKWEGSDADRKKSLRDNYFDGIEVHKPLLIRTSNLKEWMDGYVNLYGELATSILMRDSLFTQAGKTSIEKAKKGHPVVYGWMVDYFFNGYESFGIQEGIKMLEPYLNDPNCLTNRRQEINKRLKGIKTILPGTTAPDITMTDVENNPFRLNLVQTEKKYLLLLFWSADCNHCLETVDRLHSLYQQAEIQRMLDIIAISMDETGNEILRWQEKIGKLKGWTQIRAEDGLRSKVANDYFILGIPVMVLLNSKTKEIVSLPVDAGQLENLLK